MKPKTRRKRRASRTPTAPTRVCTLALQAVQRVARGRTVLCSTLCPPSARSHDLRSPSVRSLSMGLSLSSLFGRLSSLFNRQSEVRILMLGLDSAGKTTILYKLQIGEVVQTIPTIGFNVETVTYKNIHFQVEDETDLHRRANQHPTICYYANTAAVIYVVDSADRDRLSINRAELLAMLAEDELQDAKLLVFANKQDQPSAMTPAEVSEGLGLDTLKGRQWSIHKSCAIKGEGLEEGLDWLVTALGSKS